MSSEASRIYHDGTYVRNNPTWHHEEAPYKARDILNLLDKHKLRPATVCEVGCGSGAILEQLSEKLAACTRFVGYDISEQALALCRPREKENLHFVLGSLPSPEQRFELALAIDVVEHVEDYLGFLDRLLPVARHKIFRIPLNLSVQSVVFKSQPILRAREAYGHLHYFTKETALATLESAGYHIIDSFHSFSPISAKTLGPGRTLLKALKTACFSLHREWVARLLDGFSLIVLAQ